MIDLSEFRGTVKIASGVAWLHGTHRCRVVLSPSGAIDGVAVTVRTIDPNGPLRALADGGVVASPGQVRGRLDSAAEFVADFGVARRLSTKVDAAGRATTQIHFEANHFTVGALPSEVPTGATWVFRVPFVPLTHGETASERPAVGDRGPAGASGWALDTTQLEAFGRSWSLKSDVGRADQSGVPIAELATNTVADEGLADVESAVRPLLALMGLGCGRILVRTSIELRVGGTTPWLHLPATWSPRFATQGVPHVRASDPGELRRFVEQSASVFAADLLWWDTTAALFLQCGLNPFVEMKLAVLVVLLERIGSRLGECRVKGHLGEEFRLAIETGRLEADLHECLTRVLPDWVRGQTRAIVDQLRRWDRTSSYTKSILDACDELRVPAPSAATLQLRNSLLHGFDHRATPVELDDAWVRLDDLAAMLLFRMLGFTGRIFLAADGREVSMEQVASKGASP